MPLRLSALVLLALVPFVGCTWEGRPDGAAAVHTSSDGYFDDEGAPTEPPLGGRGLETAPVDAELVEPLDGEPTPGAAPVPLDQPAPTSGTEDNTSPVEEALTPGTEQQP